MSGPKRTVRTLLAGLAGGGVWLLSMTLIWGPAQAVLSDPARQSEKFLRVFSEIEPLPRMAGQPEVLALGLLVLGIVHAAVYGWIAHALPGRGWQRGLSFGVVAWALAFPWFEFYLPWNVMHEPAPLVALELALWLLTMLLVGVAIALVLGTAADRNR